MQRLEAELRNLPYHINIYPYMEDAYEVRESFFAQLRTMEEYQNNTHVREVFSEERFDALMTQYAVVLRKSV